MSVFPLPFGETVTRLRAEPTEDRFGGTSPDWSAADELDIDGCAFDPGTSTEPIEMGREAVLTKPTVYAPPASDVLAGDRLIVRGRTWQVDGDPADYRSPFSGWAPGIVIHLKAMEG